MYEGIRECFVVDKKYRRRGVASLALRAALEAIRKRGGGAVEAYPIVRRGAYSEYRGIVSMFLKEGFEIIAPFGKDNVVVRTTIQGVGRPAQEREELVSGRLHKARPRAKQKEGIKHGTSN